MNKKYRGPLLFCVVMFSAFFVFYYWQKDFMIKCEKGYTICYIPRIYHPINGKTKYDLIFKANGKIEEYEKESFGYPSIKGGRIEKEGYYFIEYCKSKPYFYSIYADSLPVDVDSTFLDSSWSSKSKFKRYRMSKERRNMY